MGPQGVPPSLVITDHEVALINALETVSGWVSLLCRWHNTGNIVAKARNKLPDELWKPFIQRWKQVTHSATGSILEERIAGMQADYGGATNTDDRLVKAWEYCQDKLENRLLHRQVSELG
jgi:hypothetical protein